MSPTIHSVYEQAMRLPSDERSKLIDLLQRSEHDDVVATLRERLDALDRGEPGVPAEQVLAEIRERLGIEGR